MIKEMKNFVIIEGILSAINLKEIQYKNDANEIVPAIAGDITVKVILNDQLLEIKPRFFRKKFNNNGTPNSSYDNLVEFMNTAKSIAAVGEEEADAVKVTGAKIIMQEYYTPDGRFITYPSVQASYIKILPNKKDVNYTAQANIEAIIGKMDYIMNSDGIETPKFQITGIHIGYNSYTDLIPIVTENESYIEAIKATYKEGDVVNINANLMFTYSIETSYEQVDIGEPIVHQKTVALSDIVLKGIIFSNYEDEELQQHQIDRCLALRKERIEKKKNRNNERDKILEKNKINLGF